MSDDNGSSIDDGEKTSEETSKITELVSEGNLKPAVIKAWPTPVNAQAVWDGCDFLKHITDNPDSYPIEALAPYLSIVTNFTQEESLKYQEGLVKNSTKYTKDDLDDVFLAMLKTKAQHLPRQCTNIFKGFKFDCTKCPNFRRVTSPLSVHEKDVYSTETTGFWIMSEPGNSSSKRIKPCYDDLLNKFVDEFQIINCHNQTYGWKKTHYEAMHPEYEIKRFVALNTNPEWMEGQKNEFLMRVKRHNPVTPEFFTSKTVGKINLKNGVYDIKKGKLYPHSKLHGFTWCLDFDYDEAAECPKWQAAIDDWMDGDFELQKTLMEFVGVALAGDKANTLLCLVGGGQNGKSTFINIINALFGSGISESHALGELKSATARFNLINKRINFCEEGGAKDLLSETGFLKKLVTGEPLTAKALYSQEFVHKFNVKLIISINEMLKTSEMNHAILRRLTFIPFDVEFSGNIENKDIERDLLKELPGILNLAADQYQSWLKNNKTFTKSAKSDEVKTIFRKENDNIEFFIEECLVLTEDPEDFVSSDLIYKMFCSHAKASGYKPIKKASFAQHFPKQEGIGVRRKRTETARGFIKLQIHPAAKEHTL